MKKSLKRLRNIIRSSLLIPWVITKITPMSFFNQSLLDLEDVTRIGEDELVKVNQIKTLNQKNNLISYHEGYKVIHAPYVIRLQNVWIKKCYVLNPSFPNHIYYEALPEISVFINIRGGQINLSGRLQLLFNIKFQRQKYCLNISSGILISNLWWKNYYHFLFDVALRVAELKHVLGDNFNQFTLIVHQQPNSFQKRYLELLGIEEEQVLNVGDKSVFVKEMVLLSHRRERYAVSPNSIQLFKKTILSNKNNIPEEKSLGPRIYISRKKASKRRVKNEQELIFLLKRFNFEIVNLEELSIDQQISVFQEARVVVSPHGAGLSNLIFSKKPIVIELLAGDYWYCGHYMTLSASIGANYYPVIGKAINEEDDFLVPLDIIGDVLLKRFELNI